MFPLGLPGTARHRAAATGPDRGRMPQTVRPLLPKLGEVDMKRLAHASVGSMGRVFLSWIDGEGELRLKGSSAVSKMLHGSELGWLKTAT